MSSSTDSKKRFLGGSRNRLAVLAVGLAALLGGSGYVIYTQTTLLSWRETEIINSVNTGEACRISRAQSGYIYHFSYEVGGKEYIHTKCIDGTVGNRYISYDPANPSKSIFNQLNVHIVIGLGVAVLGLITTLGSIFASDTATSEQYQKTKQ